MATISPSFLQQFLGTYPILDREDIKREALEKSETNLKSGSTEGILKAAHYLIDCMNFIGWEDEVGRALMKIVTEHPDNLDRKCYQFLQNLANEWANEKKYQEAIDLLEGLQNEDCVEQLNELKAFCQSSPKPLFQLTQTINAHTTNIWGLIAIDGERVASGSANGELKVSNLRTGSGDILRSEGAPPLPKAFTYLFHENVLVCPGRSKEIEFWNPNTGSCEAASSPQENISVIQRLDASRAYAQLAVGGDSGCVDLWKFSDTVPQKPQLWKTLEGPYSSISCITEIGKGKIAAASSDNKVRIWNFISNDIPIELKHNSPVQEILSLPGERLVAADSDHYIKIWNSKTGELLTDLRGFGPMPRVLLNPRVSWIVTTGNNSYGEINSAIQISDFSTHRTVANLKGHTDTPISVVPIIENLTIRYLVSGSAFGYGSMKVWDLQSQELIQTLEGHPKRNVTLLLFGTSIVSAGSDGKIKVWSRI